MPLKQRQFRTRLRRYLISFQVEIIVIERHDLNEYPPKEIEATQEVNCSQTRKEQPLTRPSWNIYLCTRVETNYRHEEIEATKEVNFLIKGRLDRSEYCPLIARSRLQIKGAKMPQLGVQLAMVVSVIFFLSVQSSANVLRSPATLPKDSDDEYYQTFQLHLLIFQ